MLFRHGLAGLMARTTGIGGLRTIAGAAFADPDIYGTGSIGLIGAITGATFVDPDDYGFGAVGQIGGITGATFADPDSYGSGAIGLIGAMTGATFADPDSYGVGAITFGSDAIAPVITSSTYTDATQTLVVNVTEVNPNLFYWALVTNPSAPTAAQIIAGTGGGILEAGSESYAGAGFSGTLSVTNEAGNELHVVVTDAAGNQSTPVDILTGVVVDNTAPVFFTSSPADETTSVAADAELTVTFTDTHAISLGAATNFYIYEGGVLSETIATSACSVLAGVVTIPHANFTASAVVSVRWDAGVVEDLYGNLVAANVTDTLVNFTILASTAGPDLLSDAADSLRDESGSILEEQAIVFLLDETDGQLLDDANDQLIDAT